MRTCSVENCNETYYAKGYCKKHCNQLYNHGKIIGRSRNDQNEITIENNILKIKLYNNKNIEIAEGLCDPRYETDIRKCKWCLTTKGYVQGTYYDENGKYTGLLHQLIIQLSDREIPDGYKIDHEDGNKLNCLDDNLRICTSSQNAQNRGKQINNNSGYKGVCWHKTNKKWWAQIVVNRIHIHLGFFDIKEDAARAYNTAAIKYHGEFAQLNIIP